VPSWQGNRLATLSRRFAHARVALAGSASDASSIRGVCAPIAGGIAVAAPETMLLREAVSPVPDATVARRVALVVTALTAGVFAGAGYAAARNHVAPPAEVPTITIANDPPAIETPEDMAIVTMEVATYRSLFYERRVMANDGRSCPDRLLELNRFDARLHAVDPWGTPYQFLCGAQYRPTFQVRSAGADRVFDTEDDVTR
jgi:hypothetical protein